MEDTIAIEKVVHPRLLTNPGPCTSGPPGFFGTREGDMLAGNFRPGPIMRSYIYVSTDKLSIYYPQVPGVRAAKTTKTAKLDLKVYSYEASVEHGAKEEAHMQIEAIAGNLRKTSRLGEAEGATEWFEGECALRTLIDGSTSFLSGTLREAADLRHRLVLYASTKHMIGETYKEAADANVTKKNVGSARART